MNQKGLLDGRRGLHSPLDGRGDLLQIVNLGKKGHQGPLKVRGRLLAICSGLYGLIDGRDGLHGSPDGLF